MAVGFYVNTTVGNYRLIDFIGAGGMGEVYRAVRMSSGEVVAIKLLLSAQGADMLQRFRNEARIHATLQHPNIARMREFIESPDAPAIAMEYIEGDSLEARIRQRGFLPVREALLLFAPIVEAIGYMHQRGVLHRDIKPSNVKIARDGTPKLLDFGIAKSAQSPKLTATGAVIGTWHYLSPEQLLTGTAEPRSDLWTLGILLYEMTTGRMPFDGGAMGSVTERILNGEYTPASRVNRSVPQVIDRMIARCLTVDVSDRYPSASAILADIRAILNPPSQKSPPQPSSIAQAARSWKIPSALAFRLPNPQWRMPSNIPFALPQAAAIRARANALLNTSSIPWQQVKPVAAFVALAILVGVTVYNITPRSIQGGGTSGDSIPVIPAPNGPQVFNYQPIRATDSQTVSVKTLELPAEVWIDGQRVGTTPYTTTRLIGSQVELVLKREGFRDTLVRFPVLVGKPEYNIQLERAR